MATLVSGRVPKQPRFISQFLLLKNSTEFWKVDFLTCSGFALRDKPTFPPKKKKKKSRFLLPDTEVMKPENKSHK